MGCARYKMIALQMRFPSLSLYRPVELVIALPYSPLDAKRQDKVIWLLHPAMEGGGFFFEKLNLAPLADACSAALVAPSLGNGYFINSPYEKQADFLEDELLPVLGEMLSLSHRREDNLLLGISMGAFGAAHWALRRPESFARVALVSGIFDASLPIDERARKNREQRPLARLFSDKIMPLLMEMDGGELSPEADIAPLYASAAQKGAPYFALWCGETDYLSLAQSRAFAKNCRKNCISLTEHYAPGGHSPLFWEGAVRHAVHWLAEGSGKVLDSANPV